MAGKNQTPSSRYLLLDALRGVAAVMVVLDHIADLVIGYYAVLVFFVISGYCVVASAESGARNGLRFSDFLRRRLRRIYPPYFFSLVFFAITRAVKWASTGVNDVGQRTALDWIQTLTLTQWVTLLFKGATYPNNNPSLLVFAHWSLCYEEQFYLVVGVLMLLAAWRRGTMWPWFFVLSGMSLALLAAFPSLCIGLFIDYWPLFAVGGLVYLATYRLRDDPPRRRLVLFSIAALCLAAFVFTFAAPYRRGPGSRYIWEDLATAGSVALALILIRPYDKRLMALAPMRLLQALGKVSYSLYLIHMFNLNLMAKLAGKVVNIEVWPRVNMTLQVGLHVALAAVFYRFFERPFLNGAIVTNASAVSGAVPA